MDYEGPIKYKDTNKQRYKGSTKDLNLHGRGIQMKFPYGAIYDGFWSDGSFIWGIVMEVNP